MIISVLQMSDPLTALMYAVQVMNFLKTLIIKTLKEREDSMVESGRDSRPEPSDENGHQSSLQPYPEDTNNESSKGNEEYKVFVSVEPALESPSHPTQLNANGSQNFLASIENIIATGNRTLVDNCPCEVVSQVNSLTNGLQEGNFSGLSGGVQTSFYKNRTGQSSALSVRRNSKKLTELSTIVESGPVERSKGASIVDRINSRTELFEAWR